MPSRQEAEEYVECFFDHVNPTYRYLCVREINQILHRVYSDEGQIRQDNAASFALVLAVLACGWVLVLSIDGTSLLNLTDAFSLRLGKGSGVVNMDQKCICHMFTSSVISLLIVRQEITYASSVRPVTKSAFNLPAFS